MKIQDHTAPACSCGQCQQAGISHRPQVRDPQSGKLLHGYELKRYWDAADEAIERWRKVIHAKGMK